MISYYIYNRNEPYISDSDDFVNMAAQIQIVLLYLALLSIYTSAHSDQNGGALADLASGRVMGAFLVVVLFFSFLAAVYVTIIDLELAAHIIPSLKCMKTRLRDSRHNRDCLFSPSGLLRKKLSSPSRPSLAEEEKGGENATNFYVDRKYDDDAKQSMP